MPDGTPDLTYRRATRGRFAPLIMISGPSGTGKTYSALRLARGMAGPDGQIFVADTDNARALLYADEFNFMHLDLREPFRPMLFEQAAIAAQKQNAAVLIVDNFAAEWAGPGGILEWHEQELTRMAGDDYQRREQLKMVCWGKVKPPHKHMYQRLYQLNMPIILCCAAEKKIAMVKQTEGKDKGKVIPVDQGFLPVGDKDAAYAMTTSLLLPDVTRPGVPVPIKALLPDLQPIIHLDRPLDEATGAAIAAWAKGEPAPQAPVRGGNVKDGAPSPSQPTVDSDKPKAPRQPRQVDEAAIEAGATEIRDKFLDSADRAAHLALVDDADIHKRMEWLKKNRRELYDREVAPAIKASWIRTEPSPTPPPPAGDEPGGDEWDATPGDDPIAELIAEVEAMDDAALDTLATNAAWRAKTRNLFPLDADRLEDAVAVRKAALKGTAE